MNNAFEHNISRRYEDIANILNLQFQTIRADSVDVVQHSELSTKYINSKILKNSNYYKNMILKLSEIENNFNSL